MGIMEIKNSIDKNALENSVKYFKRFQHNDLYPNQEDQPIAPISVLEAGEILGYQLIRTVLRVGVLAYRILSASWSLLKALFDKEGSLAHVITHEVALVGLSYLRCKIWKVQIALAILSPIVMCLSPRLGLEGYRLMTLIDLQLDTYDAKIAGVNVHDELLLQREEVQAQ